jgi:serine/threonine protein phosphatase PrpC
MATMPTPDCHGLTDRGLQRRENGDHFLIARLARSVVIERTSLEVEDSTALTSGRSGYLFLVADGLGDTPEAERASALAVDAILRYALHSMPWFFRLEEYEEDLKAELKRAMEKCQLRIEAEVEENPSRRGMGTALAMAYALWPRLYVVQVGNPRAYLLRGGKLDRVTKAEAPSVIGGGTSALNPEVYRASLEIGDILLLATDGLTLHVPDPRIGEILRTAGSARQACESLVDAANEGGGSDNVSVVVARFLKTEDAPRPADALKAEVQKP